jgi:hypothetical protein
VLQVNNLPALFVSQNGQLSLGHNGRLKDEVLLVRRSVWLQISDEGRDAKSHQSLLARADVHFQNKHSLVHRRLECQNEHLYSSNLKGASDASHRMSELSPT